MAFVVPSFMWADIVRMYHYIKKNMLARDVTKVRLDGPKSLISTANLWPTTQGFKID